MLFVPAQNRQWNVQSRWSVVDTRTFASPVRRVEAFVHDIVSEATGQDVHVIAQGRWRAALRRPLSLFDACEMTVALTEEDDSTRVDAEVVFDASSWRLGLVFGITTSVVGFPFAEGWRWGSTRGARADARSLLDAVWRGLESCLSTQAYR